MLHTLVAPLNDLSITPLCKVSLLIMPSAVHNSNIGLHTVLQTMDLKVGESQEMLVWAFPKALEAAQDTLLGRIASNPTPVEFPMSCMGAKPQVEVRLDMPAPAVAADAAAGSVAAAVSVDGKVPETKPVTPPAAAAKPAAVAASKKGSAAPEPPLTPRSKVS